MINTFFTKEISYRIRLSLSRRRFASSKENLFDNFTSMSLENDAFSQSRNWITTSGNDAMLSIHEIHNRQWCQLGLSQRTTHGTQQITFSCNICIETHRFSYNVAMTKSSKSCMVTQSHLTIRYALWFALHSLNISSRALWYQIIFHLDSFSFFYALVFLFGFVCDAFCDSSLIWATIAVISIAGGGRVEDRRGWL